MVFTPLSHPRAWLINSDAEILCYVSLDCSLPEVSLLSCLICLFDPYYETISNSILVTQGISDADILCDVWINFYMIKVC